MLDNLFSLFSAPRRVLYNPQPYNTRYRPPGVGEEHFNMLESLQMAVREELRNSEKTTAAEMLHGANSANLRKQVCTFQLSIFYVSIVLSA